MIEVQKNIGFYSPSEEQIGLLQSILEDKSHEPVSFKEAQEIGVQLISLYECLARDRSPAIGTSGNEQH